MFQSNCQNSCQPPITPCPPPCYVVNDLQEDLCNIRVELAATRANLVNLARIMCMNNCCLSQEEEALLLIIEASLKTMGCNLQEAMADANLLANELC